MILLSAQFVLSLRAETIIRGTLMNAPAAFFRLAFTNKREQEREMYASEIYERESVTGADNWPTVYIHIYIYLGMFERPFT